MNKRGPIISPEVHRTSHFLRWICSCENILLPVPQISLHVFVPGSSQCVVITFNQKVVCSSLYQTLFFNREITKNALRLIVPILSNLFNLKWHGINCIKYTTKAILITQQNVNFGQELNFSFIHRSFRKISDEKYLSIVRMIF